MKGEQGFYEKLEMVSVGDIITSPTGIALRVALSENPINMCSGCVLCVSNSPTDEELASHMRMKENLGIDCFFAACSKGGRRDSKSIVLKLEDAEKKSGNHDRRERTKSNGKAGTRRVPSH